MGDLFKRVLNTAVFGLAALTYFLVPIGQKTAFQHTIAIFTSPPAREAGTSFAEAGRRAANAVHTEVQKLLASPPGEGAAPRPPQGASPAGSRP